MKFCVTIIGLLLCCFSLTMANECPTVCTAEFRPVCGEARVKGQLVRCQFSNACQMGSSACLKNINWRASSCDNLSSKCSYLI